MRAKTTANRAVTRDDESQIGSRVAPSVFGSFSGLSLPSSSTQAGEKKRSNEATMSLIVFSCEILGEFFESYQKIYIYICAHDERNKPPPTPTYILLPCRFPGAYCFLPGGGGGGVEKNLGPSI